MRYARCHYQGSSYWGELRGDYFHSRERIQPHDPIQPREAAHKAELIAKTDDIAEPIARANVRLEPPCQASTIVCVGKNYADHIQEMAGVTGSGATPQEPGLFLKAVNTLCASGDAVTYPRWTEHLHYEGELALVLGKALHKVTPAQALESVLGYTCALDITARDKQRSDLQWLRAKSADGFCPLGPWLETELEPHALGLQTRVNGEVKQDGNTRDLIFNIPEILSYISQFMTLRAGDVVLTGTPAGVGALQAGDRLEVTIEGIGSLHSHIVAEAPHG